MEQIQSGPMSGRTVLVTGASSGIGKATALGLARLGAHVAITGRDPERTNGAAREMRAAGGGRVDVFIADLSSQSDVRRLAAEVLQRFPRIDVLVNNVGGYWNTRHVTGDGLEHTLCNQPSRTVPTHESTPGTAEAKRAGSGGHCRFPRPRDGANRVRRPASASVVLRCPNI